MTPTTKIVSICLLCCLAWINVVHAQNRIDVQRPDAPELAAYGEYETGTRPIELINPAQLDVLALDSEAGEPDALPVYDRPLPIQLWYPSFPGATGRKDLKVFLRDAQTEIDLFGQATKWAAPVTSAGGYGAVITAGGGVTAASVEFPFSPPFGTLGIHQSGSDTHNALPDSRVKTAIAFAPWGRNSGFFDAEGMDGIQIPMLFVAGSQDDVSLYENGIRAIWEEAVNVDRALLTFENANHNAAAPFPAPAESYVANTAAGTLTFDHYADAVWDTARMNNIAQHFTTVWLDRYLKMDATMDTYLDLIPNANDGIYSVEDDGSFSAEHTYWTGFENRSAKGLMFEWLRSGESS